MSGEIQNGRRAIFQVPTILNGSIYGSRTQMDISNLWILLRNIKMKGGYSSVRGTLKIKNLPDLQEGGLLRQISKQCTVLRMLHVLREDGYISISNTRRLSMITGRMVHVRYVNL